MYKSFYETAIFHPRVIVIGEQPNCDRPFGYVSPVGVYQRLARGAFTTGSSREKLLSLGLKWQLSANLLGPGPWRPEAAEYAALALQDFAKRRDLYIVTCGARVARALGLDFKPTAFADKVLQLPHPSGRCRWWNDNDASPAVAAFMERVNEHR